MSAHSATETQVHGTDRRTPETPQEAEARAHTYGLLAALLASPPGDGLLEGLRRARVEVDPDPEQGMAAAWKMLSLAAAHARADALDDEYHDLFIGLGRGELVPYGSWYLTGFLMDRPLAYLRRDLQVLGIERQEGVHEPEDHIAALCETMSVLIGCDDEIPFDVQSRFFREHIEPWAGVFFRDLQDARKAVFYRSVGRLGEAFMDFESRYLSMAG